MNAITTEQTFEQKMMTRIKDSIGDLMTDEQLRGILEKGVEKAFFEGEKKYDQYQRAVSSAPSLVEQAVRELLATKMKETLADWLRENPERIDAIIKDQMAEGAAAALLTAIQNIMTGPFHSMVNGVQEQIYRVTQR